MGNDNSDNGASFRLFDENNYWSGAAEYEIKSSKQVVVDLNNMYKGNPKVNIPDILFKIRKEIYIIGKNWWMKLSG